MLLAEGKICVGQCVRRLRTPVTCPLVDKNYYILAVIKAFAIAKRINEISAWSAAPLRAGGGVTAIAFVGDNVYMLGYTLLYKVILQPYLQCNKVRVLMPATWKARNKGSPVNSS